MQFATRRRPSRPRPRVEALEVRALMSTTAGALDPSFGGGFGYSTLPLGVTPVASNLNGANVGDVAVQADGKIVVGGDISQSSTVSMVLTRFNADGSVDTTFGQGGTFLLPRPNFSTGTIASVVIQPDGKIVAAGSETDFNSNTNGNESFLALRVNADGALDTTFGNQGVVEVPGATTSPGTPGLGGLEKALLQADGKILLAGTDFDSSTDHHEFAAVRLNADGSLDTSFGQGGTALVPITVNGFTSDFLSGAALQADGKILLAGDVETGQKLIAPPDVTEPLTEVAVVRLNADGTVDTTYGGTTAAGTVLLPPDPSNPATLGNNSVTSVALQSDGKLLLSGADSVTGNTSVSGNTLYRLDTGGLLDPTLGTNGRAMPILSGHIAIQADGKIVVAGMNFVAPVDRAAVARLNADGSVDTTFGDPGTPGLAQAALNFAKLSVTLAIQPSDGKILLAGTSSTPTINGPVLGFAVGRLLPAASTGPAATPTPVPVADYDGSGRTNIAIYVPYVNSFAYRPTAFLNSPGFPDEIVAFGVPGAGQTIPAPGNYDGFGQTQIAAYLPSFGVYAIRPLDGSPDRLVTFGIAGAGQSIPAPGDYEGTGRDDIAVYMPSIATFGIRPSTGGPDKLVPFGIAGAGQSIPAPADYFGTGQTDIAVYLAALGAFAIRPPGGGADEIIPFGLAGVGKSIPVPGDYDGSGHTELAVYLPSLGVFAYRPYNGGPDVIVPFGTANDGSLPVPGDYDGSGRTNIAIYDPNFGAFAYRPANGGPDVIIPFGTAKDGSIPAATPEGALPFFAPAPTPTPPAKAAVAAAAVPSSGNSTGTVNLTKAAATPAGPKLAARRVALSPVTQASFDPLKTTLGS